MIDLHIGQVSSKWRKLFGIKNPYTLHYLDDEGEAHVLAVFVGDGHDKFWGWMDDQAEQLRHIVDDLKRHYETKPVEPKPGVRRRTIQDYKDESLG